MCVYIYIYADRQDACDGVSHWRPLALTVKTNYRRNEGFEVEVNPLLPATSHMRTAVETKNTNTERHGSYSRFTVLIPGQVKVHECDGIGHEVPRAI